MFLDSITSGGAFPLLEKMVSFSESRNRVLAENIANITTPGYRTKQLDVGKFQEALREASSRRKDNDGKFVLEDGDEFGTNEVGQLEVRPSREPVRNLLFHDGTNARTERLMTDLAENTMMHQTATELLKTYYGGIQKAIRGRAQ